MPWRAYSQSSGLILGLHASCLRYATPWSISLRLVRAIPVQQLVGLDQRLARAEILAIQRELRTSRASDSEMARVVQVPLSCFGITDRLRER